MAPENAHQPYQTDTDPPTLIFYAAESTIALPYHLLRSLHFADRSIRLEYGDYEIGIHGTALGKLWKELRAYRVREIVVTEGAAAKALGESTSKCQIQRIEIERTDKENGGEAPNFLEEEA